MEPKQNQYPVVDGTGDGRRSDAILHSNMECEVHESRQIGSGQTGDGRVNIDIFRISKSKWTGMGEFNSDDHYIYYYGQESLRKME